MWGHIGHGNFVRTSMVTGIVQVDSIPVRRLIKELEKKGLLLDATKGRKARSLIMLSSGQFVLSRVFSSRLVERFNNSSEALVVDDSEAFPKKEPQKRKGQTMCWNSETV